MIKHIHKHRRPTALIAVVWFMAMMSLVHCLHSHAGAAARVCSAPDAGQVYSFESDPCDTTASGYCLACLLVNTCTAGAVDWSADPSDAAADDFLALAPEQAYFSPKIALRPSRAPPILAS